MEAQKQSESLNGHLILEKFFDVAIDLFLVVDPKGKIIFSNRSWERTLGFHPNELLGREFFDFVHPGDREITDVAFAKLHQSSKLEDFINRYVCKNGSTIYLEWRSFIEDGIIYAIARDVTQRIETGYELKKSRETYNFITQNMSDVIWMMDPYTMKFTYLSPSVEKLLGYTVAEVIAMSLEDLVVPSSREEVYARINNAIEIFMQGGEIVEEVLRIEEPVKGGGTIWTEVSGKVLKDNDGNLRVIGVSRDVTHSVKIENELKKKNKELLLSNGMRERLFSVISHDLRSPFHPILNLSEILITENETLSKNEQIMFATDIYSSAKKVMKLLEDLLKWTRMQSGSLGFKPVKLDLAKLLKEVLLALDASRAAKKISFSVNTPNSLTSRSDTQMMYSLMLNLLSNAIKFSYKGGEVKASLEEKGNTIEFTVADQGVGMSGEQITKLFNEHEIASTPGTANEKGSGLGLNLCFEFVAKHNGTIDVESEQGKGTKFIVKLPK